MRKIFKFLTKILNICFIDTRLSDELIAKSFGDEITIRNGVGYGFISTEELYHQGFLELGFGLVTSGYGDWGGGATHAVTSPLKLWINKNFIIQNVKTDGYFDTEGNRIIKNRTELLDSKVGSELIIKNQQLREDLIKLFSVLPTKHCISFSYTRYSHMVEHYINHQPEDDYKIEDSKLLNNK